MKTKQLLAAIAIASTGLMASSAFAIDGTITINGLITDTTCEIAIDGGDNDATVTLPTVSTTALAAAGEVAGSTQFNMQLTNCSADVDVRAYFESNNVDGSTGSLFNLDTVISGGADNTEVQITNKDNVAIDLRDQTNNPTETIVDGEALLTYSAQYLAVDDASTVGTVNTQLVYSLEYP